MGKLDDRAFESLRIYLERIPSIDGAAFGSDDHGNWWAKFSIDIEHQLAWHVIQELGFVLNYLSLEERLPTVFKPVSPPPYMNGGPREYLSWVIESQSIDFRPGTCAEWLASRLPDPVDDLSEWGNDDD